MPQPSLIPGPESRLAALTPHRDGDSLVLTYRLDDGCLRMLSGVWLGLWSFATLHVITDHVASAQPFTIALIIMPLIGALVLVHLAWQSVGRIILRVDRDELVVEHRLFIRLRRARIATRDIITIDVTARPIVGCTNPQRGIIISSLDHSLVFPVPSTPAYAIELVEVIRHHVDTLRNTPLPPGALLAQLLPLCDRENDQWPETRENAQRGMIDMPESSAHALFQIGLLLFVNVLLARFIVNSFFVKPLSICLIIPFQLILLALLIEAIKNWWKMRCR